MKQQKIVVVVVGVLVEGMEKGLKESGMVGN